MKTKKPVDLSEMLDISEMQQTATVEFLEQLDRFRSSGFKLCNTSDRPYLTDLALMTIAEQIIRLNERLDLLATSVESVAIGERAVQIHGYVDTDH